MPRPSCHNWCHSIVRQMVGKHVQEYLSFRAYLGYPVVRSRNLQKPL
ncbi:Uncharacterised protein [Vibrio cholerae]|nr:Uncharacterised protein [Vibrio cholerae]